MGTIQRFEEIIAWQEARVLVNKVYIITNKDLFSKDYGLKDQIRRAAVSSMTNIAEGFGRKTDKDFANFLNIAFASTTEVKSLLYVALDQQYIEEELFNELYSLSSKVSVYIRKFSKYLG